MNLNRNEEKFSMKMKMAEEDIQQKQKEVAEYAKQQSEALERERDLEKERANEMTKVVKMQELLEKERAAAAAERLKNLKQAQDLKKKAEALKKKNKKKGTFFGFGRRRGYKNDLETIAETEYTEESNYSDYSEYSYKQTENSYNAKYSQYSNSKQCDARLSTVAESERSRKNQALYESDVDISDRSEKNSLDSAFVTRITENALSHVSDLSDLESRIEGSNSNVDNEVLMSKSGRNGSTGSKSTIKSKVKSINTYDESGNSRNSRSSGKKRYEMRSMSSKDPSNDDFDGSKSTSRKSSKSTMKSKVSKSSVKSHGSKLTSKSSKSTNKSKGSKSSISSKSTKRSTKSNSSKSTKKGTTIISNSSRSSNAGTNASSYSTRSNSRNAPNNRHVRESSSIASRSYHSYGRSKIDNTSGNERKKSKSVMKSRGSRSVAESVSFHENLIDVDRSHASLEEISEDEDDCEGPWNGGETFQTGYTTGYTTTYYTEDGTNRTTSDADSFQSRLSYTPTGNKKLSRGSQMGSQTNGSTVNDCKSHSEAFPIFSEVYQRTRIEGTSESEFEVIYQSLPEIPIQNGDDIDDEYHDNFDKDSHADIQDENDRESDEDLESSADRTNVDGIDVMSHEVQSHSSRSKSKVTTSSQTHRSVDYTSAYETNNGYDNTTTFDTMAFNTLANDGKPYEKRSTYSRSQSFSTHPESSTYRTGDVSADRSYTSYGDDYTTSTYEESYSSSVKRGTNSNDLSVSRESRSAMGNGSTTAETRPCEPLPPALKKKGVFGIFGKKKVQQPKVKFGSNMEVSNSSLSNKPRGAASKKTKVSFFGRHKK